VVRRTEEKNRERNHSQQQSLGSAFYGEAGAFRGKDARMERGDAAGVGGLKGGEGMASKGLEALGCAA
jgi:hypothetical protein